MYAAYYDGVKVATHSANRSMKFLAEVVVGHRMLTNLAVLACKYNACGDTLVGALKRTKMAPMFAAASVQTDIEITICSYDKQLCLVYDMSARSK